ncbi:MAG: TIGR00269 family protein [archaeon]
MTCDRCTKEASIRLPYGPHAFCQEHFEYFFEHRVRNITRMHELFSEGDKIAVAVSGGKDSVVALNLVRTILPRHEIVGISIDEGIDGYRNLAIEQAVENYKKLDIDYKIVKLKDEIGSSMQEIVQKTHENKWKENSCTFCGVFRRKYLNSAAREMGANKLVTGHNLDDEAQSICMNFFTDRMERFVRLGPKVETTKVKEWVGRVKPLYSSPEEEVELFAQMKNYPHYNDKCCPFSHGADRNIYRTMLDQMEIKKPGTKNAIIRSYLKMKPHLQGMETDAVLQLCERCGDLSSQKTCQACLYELRIKDAVQHPMLNPEQINKMGKSKLSTGLPMLPQ